MSMFSCFPRRTLSRPPRPLAKGDRFAVKIIERHPFTTQTFCPLGLLAGEESATAAAKTYYIVIVAPSLETAYLVEEAEGKEKGGRSGVIERPPDLSKLKAFVAHGGQAVTYAPGTWHAPMVVIGENRVDFLVTQFVNGVPSDDCQEVRIAEGVNVLVGSRGMKGGWEKAKL